MIEGSSTLLEASGQNAHELPQHCCGLPCAAAAAAAAALTQAFRAGAEPHQGRVRRFPHLEGWFPTVVLIKGEPAAQRAIHPNC